MAYFEFPHTRTYDSDLGWLIKHFGLMSDNVEALETWAAAHKAEYEELADKVDGLINNLVDVISPWDSSIAYHIYSIVEYQGTNYIAIQDVPVGAMITNTDYWQPANTALEQLNAIGVITSDINKHMYYVTPELYGAVGDGVTDDTAAFAAAFAQSLPVMCYANKTYLLTAPITTSTVKYFNGNGCTILNHTGSAGNTVSQLFTFNTDAIVMNVKFDSDNDGLGSLYFYSVNSYVYNCEFTGINLATILLDHQESQVRNAAGEICIIKDCKFVDNGYDWEEDTSKLNRCITIDTNGKFALISGCVFDTVCQGVASTFDYAIVTNCKFTALSDNVFYDFSTKESWFSECAVDGSDEEGIVTQAPVCNVINSHFYNMRLSCIEMNANMEALRVTGCSFIRDTGNKINPIVTRSNTYVIKELIFDNNIVDEGSAVIQYIFVLGTCNNVSFCNNVIRGSSVTGESSTMISTTDITNFLKFIGNIIENTGSINLTITLNINASTGAAIVKDNKISTNVRFQFPNGFSNLSGSVLYKQGGVTNLFSDTRIASTVHSAAAPTTSDIWMPGTLWINRTAGTLYITTGNGNWVQVGA